MEYTDIKLTEEEYEIVSGWCNCKFYVRQLNDVITSGKTIKNHFKQLEKYHNAKGKTEQIDFNSFYAV